MPNTLTVVSWNCAQSFRTKHQQVERYEPNILIIPECENPATHSSLPVYSDYQWTGENDTQGLGIFTNGFGINSYKEFTEFKYFLQVETPVVDILAVWTKDSSDRSQSYIAQLYSVLDSHPELLDGDTIVAGDFNWNMSWDDTTSRNLEGNLGDVQRILNEHGLQSVYHRLTESSFGEEPDPTFFQHWKNSNPFHIDYVFAPKEWLNREATISIGNPDNWLDYSDHMPLCVEL